MVNYSTEQLYNLIKETGNIDEYLTKEKIRKIKLNSKQVCDLIKRTGNIEKYLTGEKIKEIGLSSRQVHDLIKETGNIEKYLTGEKLEEVRLSSELVCDLIKETGNIDNYLTKEKISDLKLESSNVFNLIKNTSDMRAYFNEEKLLELGFDDSCYSILKMMEMSKVNEDIFKLDYSTITKLLTQDNVKLLGDVKLNQISCYPNVINKFINMNNAQIIILGRCLDQFKEENKVNEWIYLCESIIDNIGDYSELIKNIEENNVQLTKSKIAKLINLLCDANYLNITNIQSLDEIESLRAAKSKELFKSENINDKKQAIFISKFGQTMDKMKQIYQIYGEDINYIKKNNEDLFYFVKSIEAILNVDEKDEKLLSSVFENVKPVKEFNLCALERKLKNEYWKLYNDDLFKIADAVKNDELGNNVYELPSTVNQDGTEDISKFNILLTSVSSMCDVDCEKYKNFYDSWNRPSLTTQHFCASYIRRDMQMTCSIPFFCYGFEHMENESFVFSNPSDFNSISCNLTPSSSREYKILAPDNQINQTAPYNEMDFFRNTNGVKRQPDYIICFRRFGKISNLELAKKASNDFFECTGKFLPILIVDQDKCEETETREVSTMIENYSKTTTKELKKMIKEKVRNNSKFIAGFGMRCKRVYAK